MKERFFPALFQFVHVKTLLAFCLTICPGLKTHAAPMVRINLISGSGAYDQTVIYMQSGATAGFDEGYDVRKQKTVKPAAFICQLYGSDQIDVNGIAPVNGSFAINLLVTTPVAGVFTISAGDIYGLSQGTSIYLTDVLTGKTVDFTNTSYTFFLADTTRLPRFVLTIIEQNGSGIAVVKSGRRTFGIKPLLPGNNTFRTELKTLPEGVVVWQEIIQPGEVLQADFMHLACRLYILCVYEKGTLIHSEKMLLE